MSDDLKVDFLFDAFEKDDILNVKRALLEGADVDTLNKKGHTTLYEAVFYNRDDIVEVLLNHGADPNYIQYDLKYRCDTTPLRLAAEEGNVTLTRLLLENGADPNKLIAGNDNVLLLNYVVKWGNMDILKLLLAYNADPNMSDCFGGALHHLLKRKLVSNQITKMNMLLDYLAHPDIKDYGGYSVLHAAVKSKNILMVSKLLACGADPKSTNRRGTSVLQTALTLDSDKESKIDENLCIVKALLKAGADVAATDRSGRTALHYHPHAKILLCLLENGAPIDAQDNRGQTPLHCAAANGFGYDDHMEALLFFGANIDIPDEDGNTLFQLCENLKNSGFNLVLLKFHAFNIKKNVTSRFDVNRLKNITLQPYAWLRDQLEDAKNKEIEGVRLYNVLKHGSGDFSFLYNNAFRNVIETDDFKYLFPQLTLLTRMCVREAEIRKSLVEELSEIFAFKLTTTMAMNLPEEVCRLIIIELDSVDLKNLKIALC